MPRELDKISERIAAMEIDASHLHVCVSTRLSDGSWECKTQSLAWRDEATNLNGDRGRAELTAAMRRICADMKLKGVSTWIALPSSYCVSRVVRGEENSVRDELVQVEERSNLYLSLGHGPKTQAVSVHQIDSRRRHAVLSVTNQKTIETLTSAAHKAGIVLRRIEPSLVSLCRLVGQSRRDEDPPALILSVDEGGVDLCICHQGMLLLDFRRAGAVDPLEVANTVVRHLSRLQRYCDRNIGHTNSQLSEIYLSGDPTVVTNLRDALKQSDHLETHDLLNPSAAAPHWKMDNESTASQMAVPLGLAMMRDSALQRAAPNLLERAQSRQQLPLSQVLRPLLIPLAATLLTMIGGWIAVVQQGARCSKLEREYAALEIQQRDSRLLQNRLVAHQERLKHFRTIESALGGIQWSRLFVHIAQCLPADVWLNAVTLNQQHELRLSGGSNSEDGVFELARWLDEVPHLSNINVRGTRPGRSAQGSSTNFEIHGEIYIRSGREGYADERS